MAQSMHHSIPNYNMEVPSSIHHKAREGRDTFSIECLSCVNEAVEVTDREVEKGRDSCVDPCQ